MINCLKKVKNNKITFSPSQLEDKTVEFPVIRSFFPFFPIHTSLGKVISTGRLLLVSNLMTGIVAVSKHCMEAILIPSLLNKSKLRQKGERQKEVIK